MEDATLKQGGDWLEKQQRPAKAPATDVKPATTTITTTTTNTPKTGS